MAKVLVKNVINVILGIAVGIMLHYFLYRYSLPAKPFIYVSF